MKRSDHISLDSVSDEPVRFDLELSFSIEALDREPLLEISPARIEGQVARIEGGYSLDARLRHSGKLECSRCLAAYPFEEDEPFSLVLYKRPPASGMEVSLEKEDLDAYFYDDPQLALKPIVEERIQMSVPMKPLCREECRGLCAHCGHDLNLGNCGCSGESGDPRWEALRGLTRLAPTGSDVDRSHLKKE